MDERSDRMTMPPSALTNADAMARLDLVRRGLICLVSFLAALFLAAVPLPYMPGGTSFVQIVFDVFTAPAQPIVTDPRPGEGFLLYLGSCLMLALVLTQPVLPRHVFDVVTPRRRPDRAFQVVTTIVAMLASFVIGLSVWTLYLLPSIVFPSLTLSPGIFEVKWQASEYVDTITAFTYTTGFAFEIPALLIGLVWLQVASRERLAKWRPYVILAAFVGALITPTPDMLNQAIVALPICLLYELGLLLARLVPADPA